MKNTTKRLLALLTAAALAASMCACGKDKSNGGTNEPTVTENYNKSNGTLYSDDSIVETHPRQGVTLPKIDIDLPGAKELSDKMASDYADIDADTVLFSYDIKYDVFCINITSEKDKTSQERVYYYDPVIDREINAAEFLAYCSVSVNEIEEQLEAVAGDDMQGMDILYIMYTGGDTYEIYMGPEGSEYATTSYRVNAQKIDFSTAEGFDNYYED